MHYCYKYQVVFPHLHEVRTYRRQHTRHKFSNYYASVALGVKEQKHRICYHMQSISKQAEDATNLDSCKAAPNPERCWPASRLDRCKADCYEHRETSPSAPMMRSKSGFHQSWHPRSCNASLLSKDRSIFGEKACNECGCSSQLVFDLWCPKSTYYKGLFQGHHPCHELFREYLAVLYLLRVIV